MFIYLFVNTSIKYLILRENTLESRTMEPDYSVYYRLYNISVKNIVTTVLIVYWSYKNKNHIETYVIQMCLNHIQTYFEFIPYNSKRSPFIILTQINKKLLYNEYKNDSLLRHESVNYLLYIRISSSWTVRRKVFVSFNVLVFIVTLNIRVSGYTFGRVISSPHTIN